MVVKSIGRKSANKNPPVFSHEFVIQNHADIVSCVVMVFLIGLMLQATGPVANLFITLHHNVSLLELGPSVRGERVLYEAGLKDLCVVFFYALVCIVMHAIVQEYVLDKISKKFHLSKSKLSSLNESGQLVVFHIMTLVWGAYAVYREGFVPTISLVWDGYPYHPMTFLLKLWWVVQASYWLHSVPELYFQRIKRDEWAGRIQQAAAGFAFVALAYGFKFQRIGCLLIILHSAAEANSHIYKLNLILRGEKEDVIDRALGLYRSVVFVLVRLMSLVLAVLTFHFGLKDAAPALLRISALALFSSFQVYLMYNFISEYVRARQESSQLAQVKQRKEKKDKSKKEKVKRSIEESDLPEVDQNTNKSVRQRQPASPKAAK